MTEAEPLVEHVAQRSPAEIFEDQIGTVGVLTPVEDTQDMGVIEGGNRPRFRPESLQECSVGC